MNPPAPEIKLLFGKISLKKVNEEFKEKNLLTRRSLTVQSRRLSVVEQPRKPPEKPFKKKYHHDETKIEKLKDGSQSPLTKLFVSE